MQNGFLEITEPDLDIYGDKAVDIGHVAGSKNDSQRDQQNSAEQVGGMQKKDLSSHSDIPPFSPKKGPEQTVLWQVATHSGDYDERKPQTYCIEE